jgi:hypothetical protein
VEYIEATFSMTLDKIPHTIELDSSHISKVGRWPHGKNKRFFLFVLAGHDGG